MVVIVSDQEPKRETLTAPDPTRLKEIGGKTQTHPIAFLARSGNATEASPCDNLCQESETTQKSIGITTVSPNKSNVVPSEILLVQRWRKQAESVRATEKTLIIKIIEPAIIAAPTFG
jgi:hypothetical protein